MTQTRRRFIQAAAAAAVAGSHAPAAAQFRLAICNETFEGYDFARACRAARKAGYTGLEVAPFTLSDDPASVPASERAQYRRIMRSEGLAYAGLHSLLTVPRGKLHITTPDAAVRKHSWEYFRRLIDLSADLGGGVMVLGSGKQRGTASGATVAEATARLSEGLASIAAHAQSRRVVVLLEPLAPPFSNVATSLPECVAIVRQIGSAAVQTMFDTHAAGDTAPHDELIRTYAKYIRHVHVNELDGRYPGSGSYDFTRVLRALKQIGYAGWVSVEVFDFKPDGESVAREAMKYLRKVEAVV